MAKLIKAVYGDALFQVAAEQGMIAEIYDEVLALTGIFLKNPEFLALLNTPGIARDEKLKLLVNALKGKIAEELMGLLELVVEKNRQEELIPILGHYVERVKQYRKSGTAHVTSAIELSRGQKKKLEEKLMQTADYTEIQIYYSVDPSILGGMIIHMGGRVLDNSIKSRLDALKQKLTGVQLT